MSPSRPTSSLLLALAAAAVLAGCGGGDDNTSTAASATRTSSSSGSSPAKGVTIADFAFKPSTLTVGGGSVQVTNADTTAHTVTADDGHSFDTGSIDPGSSGTFSITKPGSYKYHCSIHPFMHGTLVVR
jgi:plastocyanin